MKKPTAIFIRSGPTGTPLWCAGTVHYTYNDVSHISHVELHCWHEHETRDDALVCAALPVEDEPEEGEEVESP